jgi:hypothetical protein
MLQIGSKDFIDKYITRYHDAYVRDEQIRLYKALKKHFSGKYEDVAELLTSYQPSEPDWIKEYKAKIYRPITKKGTSKITSVLSKISRANDFVIIKGNESPKVADGQGIYDYITKGFGKYKSIQNWFFNYNFENFLQDANGVQVTMPKHIHEAIEGEIYEIQESEFVEPLPYYYCIEDCQYIDYDLLILKEGKKVWTIWDKVNLYKLVQNEKGQYNTDIIWVHNSGYIPFIYNGGVIKYLKDNFLYESFIAGIVPDFDQALVENTDKNAGIKMHTYLESAIYGQQICMHCNGQGQIEKKIGSSITRHTCSHCDGTGIAKSSTFADLVVRPTKGGEDALPSWAPKKYIDRNLDPIKFLSEDIKQLINSGYDAVNMSHLSEMPMNTSGTSKAYDWEQTNLFIFKVADYICQVVFKNIIKFINDQRYGVLLGLGSEELNNQLPFITTPTNYDIVGVSELEQQIALAKQNGISSSILEEMELAYVSKKFAGNPRQIAFHTNIIQLDPLRGATSDDVLTMQSTGVSQKTIITHNLINQFVTKAFEEIKNFQELPLLKRFEIVDKYAEEYLKANKPTLIPTPQV